MRKTILEDGTGNARAASPLLGRRIVTAFLACFAGLSMTFAAETNTVSGPAGFVRLTIPTNSEILVSTPFNPFDDDINAVFSNQLSGASNQAAADYIRKWDTLSGEYTSAWKADNTGDSGKDGRWFADFSTWTVATLDFLPGDGFWLGNRQGNTQTVFLCGFLLLDATGTVDIISGLNDFGYPFFSRPDVNDTTLLTSGAQGAATSTGADKISDYADGSYQQYWLLNNTNSQYHNKWVDSSTNPANFMLTPGKGYRYQATNDFQWDEPRPYANIFPTNGLPPRITGMTLNSSKDALTLTIETTGGQEERIEIYYKDLTSSNAFAGTGWQIAATDLNPGAQQSLFWTDQGSAGRGAVNTVFGRCYLAGRGDLDSDEDGVPDSRETFFYGSNPFSNDLTVLPFMEYFETDTVQTGNLNGQNKWTASPADAAVVQTNIVYEGSQALTLDSGAGDVATVQHDFAAYGEDIVWLDMYMQVTPAVTPETTPTNSAAFYFNADGKLVVYDGLQSGTNKWTVLSAAYATGSWKRVTLKLDYPAQKWLICIDGLVVADDLGFAAAHTGLDRFTVSGRQGFLDKIRIAVTEPDGVSADWDTLPDSWELTYFGDLDETDSGDPDNDGFTNLQEYQNGTDPAAPNYTVPFTENFETSTVTAGDINGQHGWISAPPNIALVGTGTVYQGSQALNLDAGTNDSAIVAHRFTSQAESIVWLDMWMQVIPTVAFTGPITNNAAMYFDYNGELVVYNGYAAAWTTPEQTPLTTGTWARLTIGMNYTTREWLVCVNDRLVAENLGFSGNATGISGFRMEARRALLDQFSLATAIPSSDDSDGDGLSDLDEIAFYGTDPVNADSDGDGATDGYEVNTLHTDPLVAYQGNNPGGPALSVVSPKEGEHILW